MKNNGVIKIYKAIVQLFGTNNHSKSGKCEVSGICGSWDIYIYIGLYIKSKNNNENV